MAKTLKPLAKTPHIGEVRIQWFCPEQHENFYGNHGTMDIQVIGGCVGHGDFATSRCYCDSESTILSVQCWSCKWKGELTIN